MTDGFCDGHSHTSVMLKHNLPDEYMTVSFCDGQGGFGNWSLHNGTQEKASWQRDVQHLSTAGQVPVEAVQTYRAADLSLIPERQPDE